MATTEGGNYAKLIVTVKSGHSLNDPAFFGKADPYVVIQLADAEIKTHHVKGGGPECAWNESFAFQNVAPTDTITFNVYDKNRVMKDAHMGEGSIPLREVFESGSLDTRVPLSVRGGTKDAGEIWVSMRKEDMGGGERAGAGVTEKETMTTTGAQQQPQMVGGGGGAATGEQAVCGQEYFTRVEDRPLVKERVTQVVEHHPVETEFVTETKPTGRVAEGGVAQVESEGVRERVVSEGQSKAPCE